MSTGAVACRTIALASLGLSVLGACGDAAPSEGSYSLVFPSVAAAVASESIQVLVFDVPPGKKPTLCAELLGLRETKTLPKPLAQTASVKVCDAQAGAGEISVGYGDRAFLAITTREAKDFLIGCALENVGTGDAPAKVFLAPAGARVVVPTTTCTTLSDACGGRCK